VTFGNNLSPVKDEPSNAKIQSREVTPDSTLKSVSSFVTADQSLNISQNNESKINRSSPDIGVLVLVKWRFRSSLSETQCNKII
jgi:hypothetical protein